MKMLRLTHLFAGQKEDFKNILRNNDDCYLELVKKIKQNGIDITGGISCALGKIGYTVTDIYFGIRELQLKWADENSIKFDEINWETNSLHSQISKLRPEIIFIQTPSNWLLDFFKKMRKEWNFIKLIVIHSVYGGNILDFSCADLLLMGTPRLVSRYKELGYKPELFYYYVDTSVLTKFVSIKRMNRPVFLGSSGYGHGFAHSSRYWLLRELMAKTNLEIWENVVQSKENATMKNKFRNQIKNIIYELGSLRKYMKLAPFQSNLSILCTEIENEIIFKSKGLKIADKSMVELYPKRCHLPVFGPDYYGLIGSSTICFHKGGDNTHDSVDNIAGNAGALRMFEVTGLGTCLVADKAMNDGDLFTPGSEMCTYQSPEEAIELINYLVAEPDKCYEISRAGKRRCETSHSSEIRANQLDILIKKELKGR